MWVTRLTISLFRMEEIPRASPAPVPTTAMNSVPKMTPASTGGISAVTKVVRAVLAVRPG